MTESERFAAYKLDLYNESPDLDALTLIGQAYTEGRLHPVIKDVVDVLSSENPRENPLRKHLAIGIEGSAIASIESCYEAATLEFIASYLYKRNIADCVQVIAGTSAGGANALYLWAERAGFGKESYSEMFCKPPFLSNPRQDNFPYINMKAVVNILRGSVVNVGYFIDRVAGDDIKLVDNDPNATILAFIATQTDRKLPGIVKARRAILHGFRTPEETLSALHGSMTISFPGAKAVLYQRKRYYDGGFVEQIPVKSIIENFEGIDKVLVLANSGVEDHTERLSFGETVLAAASFLEDPGHSLLWSSRKRRANATRTWLHQKQESRSGPPYVSTIFPSSRGPRISIIETDQTKLVAAGRARIFDTLVAFGIDYPPVQMRLYNKMLQYQWQ